MIRRLLRKFRHRKLQLGIHEGCTVIINQPGHPWNGMAGFVIASEDGFVEVQRCGEIGFFLASALSTRLAFAIEFEKPNCTYKKP